MPLKAEIRVGNLLIEAEAENNRLMIEELAFWSSLPEECPLCQQSISFHHRKPKNKQNVQIDYYEMLCAGNPQHRASLHQHNTPGKELYYKGHSSWVVNAYADRGEDEDYGDPDASQAQPVNACEACGVEMTPGQATFSRNKFGKPLCLTHQPKEAAAAPTAPYTPPGSAASAKAIDQHNKAQVASEQQIAAEGIAPPPPPKPKADPLQRNASAAERSAVQPWVTSAAEWKIIDEGGLQALLAELDLPATTPGRLKEIYQFCSEGIEAVRKASEE